MLVEWKKERRIFLVNRVLFEYFKNFVVVNAMINVLGFKKKVFFWYIKDLDVNFKNFYVDILVIRKITDVWNLGVGGS